MPDFYDSPEWRELAVRVIARDGSRCTVARLLGGACRGTLHAHHIEPRRERPDLELTIDNCATTCASHHVRWEALRRALVKERSALPPCPHNHPYAEGRRACDRRRAREAGIDVSDLSEPVYSAA